MKYIIMILLLGAQIEPMSYQWARVHWKRKSERLYRILLKLVIFQISSVDIETNGMILPKDIKNHFYEVFSGKVRMGYIYVDQAPSMKNVFDYIVLFSPELEIVKVKVLIYREKHGRQIGTKRWLIQFNGMIPNDHTQVRART